MLEFHKCIKFIWRAMVKKYVENLDSTMNDIFVGFVLSNNYFDVTMLIFMTVFCYIIANKR